MTVKIVAVTQPYLDLDADGDGIFESGKQTQMNAEQFIAYAARVSNPSNQMNMETSDKLLKYCLKNKHFSIFEMVNVVMQIDTTRDIGRQILRHGSNKFQEFSQRYADPTKDMGFVLRQARLQDTKNRQNSIEVDDPALQKEWEAHQQNVLNAATKAYNWAIDNGIAKEQARAVLPEGLTMSRMYMNGTLRSWIHWVELRSANGTQKEHQVLALQAKEELIKHFGFLKTMWTN